MLNRYMRWLLWNAVVVGLVYMGVFIGDEGFGRILMFVVWAMLLLSIVVAHMVTDEQEKEKVVANIRAKGFVSLWIDGPIDLIVTGTFFYFDWNVIGVAYALHCFAMLGVRYEMQIPRVSQEAMSTHGEGK